jgi:hypothetical protein
MSRGEPTTSQVVFSGTDMAVCGPFDGLSAGVGTRGALDQLIKLATGQLPDVYGMTCSGPANGDTCAAGSCRGQPHALALG